MQISLKEILSLFNQLATVYLVFPCILLLGAYFTVSLKGFQIRKLKESFFGLLAQNKGGQGNISHFEAISTVLAGNFGTGNISGMAVAVTTGGPGALVWMWIMAFLTSAIQYASCVLGVKYRKKNERGEYVGGPMYYLSQGLGLKKAASLFSFLTIFAAITAGNFAQINSMTLPMHSIGLNPLYCAIFLAVVVGMVILGGIERIAKIASMIVPLKAFLYLGFACAVLIMNRQNIMPALELMFDSAFDFHAAAGGALGIGVMQMITTGFNRSIFATDGGTGIIPILQASARTTNPVNDGLVTLVTPIMVMIVCTMTGLVLLTTGAWQQGLESTNMVTFAFSEGLGHWMGEYVVIIALILFGFTTILAWSYCAEKAIAYVFGLKWTRPFNYLYIALIPMGAVIDVAYVWILADISVTMMLLVNLVGVAGLSKEVIFDSLKYFKKESACQTVN